MISQRLLTLPKRVQIAVAVGVLVLSVLIISTILTKTVIQPLSTRISHVSERNILANRYRAQLMRFKNLYSEETRSSIDSSVGDFAWNTRHLNGSAARDILASKWSEFGPQIAQVNFEKVAAGEGAIVHVKANMRGTLSQNLSVLQSVETFEPALFFQNIYLTRTTVDKGQLGETWEMRLDLSAFEYGSAQE